MIGPQRFTRDEWRWIALVAVTAGIVKVAEKVAEKAVERFWPQPPQPPAPKADGTVKP